MPSTNGSPVPIAVATGLREAIASSSAGTVWRGIRSAVPRPRSSSTWIDSSATDAARDFTARTRRSRICSRSVASPSASAAYAGSSGVGSPRTRIILRYACHSVGDSNDKNDKTQMLSDSQVLEVKPSAPKLPVKPPVDDKNDRSVWRGVVVGADDFAPPAPVKSSGGRWVVVAILAAAAIGAGAYLVWPKGSTPAAIAD